MKLRGAGSRAEVVAGTRSLTYCFSWTNDKGNHTLENRAISITQEEEDEEERKRRRRRSSGQFGVSIMSRPHPRARATGDDTLMDSKMGLSAIFRPSSVVYNQSIHC